MRINHNIAALNTYRQLTGNTNSTSKSLEKLSSGLRINRAGDDAAGLAISEKMRSQIRGLDTASRNANDGISLIQTAEGALNETHSILQRMKELAVQAANDTNTTEDRAEIQKEIDQLTAEITRIADQTEFNTKKLLDGTMASKVNYGTLDPDDVTVVVAPGTPPAEGTYTVAIDTDGVVSVTASDSSVVTSLFEVSFDDSLDLSSGVSGTITVDNKQTSIFHIGANKGQNTSLSINKMDAESLGVNALNLTSQKTADEAITTIDNAISKVSSQRAALGAMQNRLEHTINNLGTAAENLTAAESRIRDVDMAKEMMEFTKNNILSQASQAMLAQANMQPQSVLQLLQ